MLATPSIAAAAKGLTLLVQTSPTFVQWGGCNSFHNQMLPAAAQAFARSRGVDAGTPLVQLPFEVSENTTERYIEYAIKGRCVGRTEAAAARAQTAGGGSSLSQGAGFFNLALGRH